MAIDWIRVRRMNLNPANGPSGKVPLCVPNVASTLETDYAAAGQIYYDSSNTRLRAYINGAWTTIGAAGAASDADSIYNGGSWIVTVDANDVRWDLSTGYNHLINAAAAGTTAVGIEINDNTSGAFTDGILFTAANLITDAIDASASSITNAINIGANAIAGTNFSVTGAGVITSTGITDSGTAALTTVTCTSLTAGTLGLTTLTAPTIQSATGGNVALAIDAAGSGTIGIGATSTGAVTITPATTITGALTLSSNLTMSAGGLDVTAGAGDGDAVDIVNLVASAAIDIDVTAATTVVTGVIDIDASTGSAPILAVNFSDAYTGNAAVLNMTNAVGASAIALTGAGTRTVSLVSVTDTPSTSATFDLNVTPAGAQAGANVFDIDVAGTGSANVVTVNFAAAYTGDAFSIDMTNAVAASAFDLVGAGTRTVPLIAITDVPTTSAPSIDLNITPGAAVQAGIDIDVAGTSGADIIAIDFSAAHTGDALNITMTNGGAGAQAIVVDGSLANSGAIVSLSTSGISTGAGSVLTASSSTQPGAANVGVVGRFLETGAAQATTYAVQIDSTNNEALNVSTGRAHFAESISSLASNACGLADNYVQAAGSANAITVAAVTDATGTTIPLADGLRLVIDLNTRTLQAGANTLNYAAGGNVSITKGTDPAANIGTAYAANGVIEVVYSAGATAWLCVSQ